jgi:methylglutaconyl-CoA hydratase
MEELIEIEFTHDEAVARVWLNRPKVHNALNRELIERLIATFHDLPKKEPVRIIILGGRGPSFCAGADLGDMKVSAHASYRDNRADAERIGNLFAAIAECPRPVIARAHGNVFGGGVGLVCATDLAVGAQDCTFSISEVRLGIIPGLISPYLLRRMGDGRARPLMLSGERFSGKRAHDLGLLDDVAPSIDIDRAIENKLRELLKAGPEAQARVKEVLRFNADNPISEVLAKLPDKLAEVRSGDEAREGFDAFFEKRTPTWIPDPEKPSGRGG